VKPRFENAILAAAAALFAGLVAADCLRWHPGFSFFDEGHGNLSPVQIWVEGGAWPGWDLFKESLHRNLAGLLMRISGGGVWVWQGLALASVLLETALLHALARRWISREGAFIAVLLNLACASVFLRARTLCAYGFLPAELLLLLWLMPRCKGGAAAFAWGALAALMGTDYEGWIFGWAALALLWCFESPEERPAFRPAFLAFLGVLALLAWSSREYLAQQALLRSRMLQSAGPALLPTLRSNFASLFQGAACYPYLGVRFHAALPPVLWPGMLAGALFMGRQRWKWLAWIALGWLPLGLAGTAGGPNRLVVAWPACCLLSAAGLAWIWPRLGTAWKRWAPFLAAAGLALAVAAEAAAYKRSMDSGYDEYYAESAAQMRLAEGWKREGKRPDLVTELDNESSAAWRVSLDARHGGTGGALAVVPLDYARPRQKAWGRWTEIRSEKGRPLFYLLDPAPQALARLRGVERELRPLRAALPPQRQLRRLRQMTDWLAGHKNCDPWLRSALLENALGLAFMTGELPPELARQSLFAPLHNALAPSWLAEKAAQSGDAAFARRLCARAREIQPGWPCAY
jgi:hypothetical protein